MDRLYRIAYCSRSHIPACDLERELHAILDVARRKNLRLGVTGALLYNGGGFAQVLEGPLPAIERIFESIQCDPRHGDVMVLDSGPIEVRTFPAWSMAFAGSRQLLDIADATAAFEDTFALVPHGSPHLLRLLRDLVIDDGEWAGDAASDRPTGDDDASVLDRPGEPSAAPRSSAGAAP